MTDESARVFSKSQLVDYCKQNSNKLIISIHENVYDVTKFADEHPGGEEALREHQIKDSFKDATEAFEDVGHSMDARDLMKKYMIAKLDTPSSKSKQNESQKQKEQQNSNCVACTKWYVWLLPVVVAIGFGLLYKSYK